MDRRAQYWVEPPARMARLVVEANQIATPRARPASKHVQCYRRVAIAIARRHRASRHALRMRRAWCKPSASEWAVRFRALPTNASSPHRRNALSNACLTSTAFSASHPVSTTTVTIATTRARAHSSRCAHPARSARVVDRPCRAQARRHGHRRSQRLAQSTARGRHEAASCAWHTSGACSLCTARHTQRPFARSPEASLARARACHSHAWTRAQPLRRAICAPTRATFAATLNVTMAALVPSTTSVPPEATALTAGRAAATSWTIPMAALRHLHCRSQCRRGMRLATRRRRRRRGRRSTYRHVVRQARHLTIRPRRDDRHCRFAHRLQTPSVLVRGPSSQWCCWCLCQWPLLFLPDTPCTAGCHGAAEPQAPSWRRSKRWARRPMRRRRRRDGCVTILRGESRVCYLLRTPRPVVRRDELICKGRYCGAVGQTPARAKRCVGRVVSPHLPDLVELAADVCNSAIAGSSVR